MSMDWYDRRLLAEISEALQPELKRIGDILYDLTYKTEVERRTIFRKEKSKAVKERNLEIGIAINSIALALDNKTLERVGPYLNRIEEIMNKEYEEVDHDTGRTDKTD